MKELKLACDCGQVAGALSIPSPRTTIRLLCYCDDCQAFANTLGRGNDLLDEYGGTDIVQCTLPQVTISQGRDLLRSLRLTRRGILRWHTDCCKTAIANTVSVKLPFVGLITGFIRDERAEDVLGPPEFKIQGRFAKNAPADSGIHPKAPLGLILRVAPRILAAKMKGGSTGTCFFTADGSPTVDPYIVA